MARGVNKVILLGNLGSDPEMRQTQAGKSVANLSIATSESWADKQTGQKQEKTEWHKVVFFDKLAEIAGQYLKKGSKVYVEGKLQTRKWQNQQGVDQYTTEIVGNEMQMLDGKSDNQGGGQQGGYQQPAQQPQAYQQPQQPQAYSAPQQQQYAQPQQYAQQPQQQAVPPQQAVSPQGQTYNQGFAQPQAYQQQQPDQQQLQSANAGQMDEEIPF